MNSKIANGSFVIFTSVDDFLQELTDEQAGQLFKAIVTYAKSGEIVEMNNFVKLAFISVKQQIDYNKEKYKEVQEKRAEAGRKGAEKRWQIANANFAKNENSKNGLIDIDIDNVIDIDKKKNKQKKIADVPDELRDVIDLFIEHRKALKKPITAHGIELIVKKSLQFANDDMQKAKAIIEQSIERGWQGVFPLDASVVVETKDKEELRKKQEETKARIEAGIRKWEEERRKEAQ